MSKLKVYEELKDEILNCFECDLGCKELEGYDSHVVGSGNLNANIVFIAEAPAFREQVEGVCLAPSGVSGGLYKKILKTLGLVRGDVYTTNVVSCRTSLKNCDPCPWEVLKCKPYFKRQLKLVKPKIVVTFGRFAAQAMLGSFKITRDHG
ncbi:hypothetical protein LCGC14_2040190, partial [marine sediment metagenome]